MAIPHDEPDPFTPTMREVRYEFTPNLPEILQSVNASLMVTTYQAGKLLILGVSDGKLKISFSSFEQAMGLAIGHDRIALGSRRQIHFLIAAHECVQGNRAPEGAHDACFVPRSSHYTGHIHGHDLAWGDEGLWVVNTLFSCLCTLHDGYNFVPRWRPRFISQLIDQDRCHLNGLALEHGQPRYVTALSETDEPAGWRPGKNTGGCVIDVPTGETIARGFAMPHSPRVYRDQLWVLDSGNGRCGVVDPSRGAYQIVETMPGYTRGLAFAGPYAFVGLSKIRETAIFGGVPIAARSEELRCGIGVIDLRRGQTVAVFQFHSGVDEIYAVEALTGFQHPLVAGASLDEREHDIWIVPPPNHPPPVIQPSFPIFARKEQAATQAVDAAQLAAQAAILQRSGRFADAAALLEKAIELSDRPAALWVDLGNLRQEQGDQDRALECYRQAVKHDGQCIAARQNLGYLLFNRGQPELALEQYDQLLALAPTPMNHLLAATVFPVVYESIADVQRWRGQLTTRLSRMASEGMHVDATHQLIPTVFFLAYQGLDDLPVARLRAQIVRGHGPTHLATESTQRSDSTTTAARSRTKIRIGFLSAYLREHTIGRLNVGRVEQLDRDQFDVTVLFASRADDEMANRFRHRADRSISLSRDVATAYRTIRELDLDILFFADVGMDALTSTLAFSRMARVQCVTWGHPDTTGSPTMDYFVSSQLLETASADAHYSERLVRLPLLATYYERPTLVGPPRDRAYFGLSQDRHIYVCPQTLFKFHPEFDEILAAILRADRDAEIVVIEGRVPEWTNRLRERWSRTLPGGSERTRFLAAQPRDDFLGLLACADVVIDSMHFGGGNTSYEALGMGIPVVTLPGEFLRSRITLALYKKMGLNALVADSKETYVDLAVRICHDERYRSDIIQQITTRRDVLFEDPAEVRCFEDGLRSIHAK